MIYFLILSICFLAEFASYWTTWTFALLIFCGYTVYTVSKNIHWSVGLCVGVSTLSTVSLLLQWNSKYTIMDQTLILSFQHLSVLSLVSLLMMVAFGLFINKPDRIIVCERALVIGAFISSGVAIAKFLGMHINAFGNESMNGCYIVMAMPFLKRHFDERLLGILALGIVCTLSSVPIVAMCIVMTILYARDVSDYFVAAIIPAFLFMGVENFSNSTGRFSLWRAVWDWFYNNGSTYLGMGNGTFFMWGPHIQQHASVNIGNWFVWAHNDYLQILLELGWTGLLSVCVMIIYLIRYSLNRKYLVAALAGYLCMSGFNFMVHLPIHAAVGVLLTVSIFHGRENRNGQQKTSREVFG